MDLYISNFRGPTGTGSTGPGVKKQDNTGSTGTGTGKSGTRESDLEISLNVPFHNDNSKHYVFKGRGGFFVLVQVDKPFNRLLYTNYIPIIVNDVKVYVTSDNVQGKFLAEVTKGSSRLQKVLNSDS